jgi:hypothetical protein
MTKHWSLINKRTLVSPTGVNVQLFKDAVDVVSFGDIAVVLLNYDDVLSKDIGRNVVAYNESGCMIWKIGLAPLSRNENPYTEIAKMDEKIVLLGNWIGFTLHVDPATGKILQKEESH